MYLIGLLIPSLLFYIVQKPIHHLFLPNTYKAVSRNPVGNSTPFLCPLRGYGQYTLDIPDTIPTRRL